MRTYSAAITGVEARVVDVEVDFRPATRERYTVVGLPDPAVRESGRRVIAAIANCGYRLPPTGTVTVNLAPANLRKEGSCFDLPIALALIGLMGHLPPDSLSGCLLVGELSLDGKIRPVRGALAVALSASRHGFRRIFVPCSNSAEAALVTDVDVYAASSIQQVMQLLVDPEAPTVAAPKQKQAAVPQPDLADVRGQAAARRALEVACAGGHNLLMVGPPGAGKTMLARRIPSLLAPLTPAQSLESTAIHSVCGQLAEDTGLVSRPPFRAPHHTVSAAGLAGGGPGPTPGEVSLAHHGVLFLDELPEFSRSVLEVLRQPLEQRTITISRARNSLTFPAHFVLTAAMNPCPCGHFGSNRQECLCTPGQIRRYRAKISGPLLDRIDLQVQVPEVEVALLRSTSLSESSAKVAARIRAARKLQSDRYRNDSFVTNADLDPPGLSSHCHLDDVTHQELENVLERLGLSARAYHRILRVSRTIADLAESQSVKRKHVAEAVRYRSLDCQDARVH